MTVLCRARSRSGRANRRKPDPYPSIYFLLNFKVAAQPGDVALWRGAKKFFVIAAKIRRILIADAKAGACCVEVFAEHKAAGFLKPDLFLKLQRAHRRHGFEVMMKAGNAHSEFAGDILDPQWLVESFTQMPDRL